MQTDETPIPLSFYWLSASSRTEADRSRDQEKQSSKGFAIGVVIRKLASFQIGCNDCFYLHCSYLHYVFFSSSLPVSVYVCWCKNSVKFSRAPSEILIHHRFQVTGGLGLLNHTPSRVPSKIEEHGVDLPSGFSAILNCLVAFLDHARVGCPDFTAAIAKK
jgi:hypothetical protein